MPVGADVRGRMATAAGPVTLTVVGVPTGWAALGAATLLGVAAAVAVALLRR